MDGPPRQNPAYGPLVSFKMRERIPWTLALALYAGLIFWLSSQSFPEGPPLFRFAYGDKLFHLLEYGLFGLLAWKAFRPQGGRGLAWSLFLTAGYAGSDELHQLLVPTRSASLADWGADLLGILLGFGLGALLRGLTAEERKCDN